MKTVWESFLGNAIEAKVEFITGLFTNGRFIFLMLS